MSVVWARHFLLKRESRFSGNGDLMNTRQSGEGTSSVTVKVNGKTQAVAVYRVIAFPNCRIRGAPGVTVDSGMAI